MSLATSVTQPVVRSVSSNQILPANTNTVPSSGFVGQSLLRGVTPGLDGLVVGAEPGKGTQRAMQVGRAYNFDRTDDVVGFGSIGSVQSYSLWLEPDSITATTDYVLDLNGTDYLTIVNGTVTLNGQTGTVYIDGLAGSTIPNITDPHLISVVLDSAVTASDCDLGRVEGSGFYGGLVFDLRVYDSALTLSEVRELSLLATNALANKSTLLHLKCDDTHPKIAPDSSGNGNDGTKTGTTASTFHFESSSPSDTPFNFQNDKGFTPGLYLAGGTGAYTRENSWIGDQAFTGDFTVEYEIAAGNSFVIAGVAAEQLQATNSYLLFDFAVNWQSSTQVRTWENGSATVRATGATIGTRTRHKFVRVGSTITYYLDGVEIHSVTNSAPMYAVASFNVAANQVTVLQHNGTAPQSYSGGTGLGTQTFLPIPRDESSKANDVFGNTLLYSGKCPRNSQYTKSNCGTFDGVDDYLAVGSLTGSETVVSSDGTSTPSISAGRIDFTAGTCWNLVLSNGNHYTFSEGGQSVTAHDVVNGAHGTLTSITTSTFWAATQDDWHWSRVKGCTKYTHASENPIFVPYDEAGSPVSYTPPSGYSKDDDHPAGAFINKGEGEVDLTGGIVFPNRNWAVRDSLLSDARNLSSSNWVKVRATVSDNLVDSPRGLTEADKIVEDTSASNTHAVYHGVTLAANSRHTAMFAFQPAERSGARLILADSFGSNGIIVDADFTTGTLSNGGTTGSGWTYEDSTIEALGDYWIVTLTGVAASDTAGYLLINLLNDAGSRIYTGDGSSGLYATAGKVEQWYEYTGDIDPDRSSEDLPTNWTLGGSYDNPLFHREITKGGVLHRADRLGHYTQIMTGQRLTAIENNTATITV